MLPITDGAVAARPLAAAPQAGRPDDASWLGSAPAGEPDIVGHRGVKQDGIDENSIESLLAAAREGADAVELDIQFLEDGTPILAHDDHGYSGMSREAFLAGRGVDGAGYPVPPTLEEWSAVLGGDFGDTPFLGVPRAPFVDPDGALAAALGELDVFVEFKADALQGYDGGGNEQDAAVDSVDRARLSRALDVLSAAGIDGDRLAVASFSVGILNAVNEIDPSLTLGLFADREGSGGVTVPVLEQLGRLDRAPDFVSLNGEHLGLREAGPLDVLFPGLPPSRADSEALLAELAGRGIDVSFAATSAENIEIAETFIDDIDAIITDTPEATRDALD